MTPSAETFALASVMFRQAWDAYLEQATAMVVALKADIVRLDRQIEQLLDRLVEASNASTVAAYERRIAKLEKDRLIAAERLNRKPGPRRSFDDMFELACGFLSSPSNLWKSQSLNARRMVLKLAFAERLAYGRNEGFRTPKTTMPFKMLADFETSRRRMADDWKPDASILLWFPRNPSQFGRNFVLADY